MGRVLHQPGEKTVKRDDEFNWKEFVSGIIKGDYVLFVGSEIMLQKQYGGGDSVKAILDAIAKDYGGGSYATFTEFARRTYRNNQSIRDLISDYLLGNEYRCEVEEISEELKRLVETRFFRIIVTTTFDNYLEELMTKVWGKNKYRTIDIYDDPPQNDFTGREQTVNEFEIEPTLYYLCGKVKRSPKKFTATERDMLETLSRWYGLESPSNMMKHIKKKGIISIGCNFEDWIFRFFWYKLRPDNIESLPQTRDAVAVSMNSDSGIRLDNYLKEQKVHTEPDSRKFIDHILDTMSDSMSDMDSISEMAKSAQAGGVFISYASEDLPQVVNIVSRFRKEGFNVWFDAMKLESGAEYINRICNAINQCKVFVPILSAQVQSDIEHGKLDRFYINHEWSQAISNKKEFGLLIKPIAINGYDEKADYHKKTPFYDSKEPDKSMTVLNMRHAMLSTFVAELRSLSV